MILRIIFTQKRNYSFYTKCHTYLKKNAIKVILTSFEKASQQK